MDKTYRVLEVAVEKQGTGKTGKPYTIRRVTLDGFSGKVTGFGSVAVGDMVTVETIENGEYTNYNYKIADGSAAGAAAADNKTAGNTDKRTLKLLVLVADAIYRMQKQMGVPEDDLLTPDKVKQSLQVN